MQIIVIILGFILGWMIAWMGMEFGPLGLMVAIGSILFAFPVLEHIAPGAGIAYIIAECISVTFLIISYIIIEKINRVDAIKMLRIIICWFEDMIDTMFRGQYYAMKLVEEKEIFKDGMIVMCKAPSHCGIFGVVDKDSVFYSKKLQKVLLSARISDYSSATLTYPLVAWEIIKLCPNCGTVKDQPCIHMQASNRQLHSLKNV